MYKLQSFTIVFVTNYKIKKITNLPNFMNCSQGTQKGT